MNQRSNVLMIVLDQLRYDCVGRTSSGRVQTPVLDQLASTGVWFDQAYSHLPTCCPARQSLLTGQRPETMGTLWNYDISLPIPSLTPEIPTWPVRLQDAGYRSSYIGKWHVSSECDPTAFGYDRYIRQGAYRHDIAQRYPDKTQPDLTHTDGFFGGVSPLPVEDGAPHWFAHRAADEIRRLATHHAPWHVRLDLEEPHLPCQPPAEYAARYPIDSIDPWPSFAEDFTNKPYIQRQQLHSWGVADWDWEDWAPVVARYYAVINQIDDAIGVVLDALNSSGQRDNTIIVVTTDHGDMCGAHRMLDKHYVLYDDVIRVPLIISGPRVPQGQARQEFVYNLLDLGPTLLELLDLEPLPNAAGRSLTPLLHAKPRTHDWRDSVVLTYNGQHNGLYTQRAIRTSDWKYIWNATDVDELYNLNADPHELVNLAGDERAQPPLARLRLRLFEHLDRAGDRQVHNPWVRRQLLGGAKV